MARIDGCDGSVVRPFSDDDNFDLWVLLDRTRTAMYRARRKELRSCGILPRQAAILYLIEILGQAATPTEMAAWLFRTPHAVYELATRMEVKGLIKKIPSRRKREGVHYVLTDAGRDVYRFVSRRETINSVMGLLGDEERSQLRHCLEKLRNRALIELGSDG